MGFAGVPTAVATVEPPKPAYDAPAEAVAEAVAVVAQPSRALTSSPRPMANPRRGGVALALADATDAAPPPEVATVMPGAVALALTESAQPIVPPVDAAATEAAVGIALMSTDTVAVKDEEVAEALTEALELAASVPSAADGVTDLRPRARPLTGVTTGPVAAEVAELAAPAAATPAPEDTAGSAIVALRTDLETDAPFDSLALATDPEGGQEVVTRFSTSGGRHWSINVGRFASRYEAERVLLQTALGEIETLDEALRKVVRKPTGFEANFVGLSEGQAQLACARLNARNRDCTAIGPG
jgi:D-alanyl-D-alanine carboxypeptidase